MAAGRTHHPRWNRDRCMGCGACRRACPARVDEALAQEPDSLRGRVAREHPFGSGDEVRTLTPCAAACPLGQDVPGYLGAIAAGDLDRARRIILGTNPMPRALSRMCSRACTLACVRATLDEPLRIRELKAVPFLDDPGAALPVPAHMHEDRVVHVVGAGPAGLAAAATLVSGGVRPHLWERQGLPGGLLASAVPSFVLPARHLRADARAIVTACASFETGVEVDDAWIGNRLGETPGGAVILATGARPAPLPAAMDAGRGVVDLMSFMRRVKRSGVGPINGSAVVCGEGPASLAAARTAGKLGASSVHLVTSRPVTAMAGDRREILRIADEGVRIQDGWSVERIRRTAGGLRVTLERRVPRAAGADRVVPGERAGRRALMAEVVVVQTRRVPDPSLLWHMEDVRYGPAGHLLVDHDTMAVGPGGLFAAGEAVTGSRTLVEAVASGVRAARGVLSYLGVSP